MGFTLHRTFRFKAPRRLKIFKMTAEEKIKFPQFNPNETTSCGKRTPSLSQWKQSRAITLKKLAEKNYAFAFDYSYGLSSDTKLTIVFQELEQ